MTFKETIDALGEELGVKMEIENDTCAVSLSAKEGDHVTILLQGQDERGMMLTCADLGEPPPEGREALYQSLLEANDLYGGTAGATLSLDSRTGRVRIQRIDALDALADVGFARAFIAFADTAAAWKRLIADFRTVAKDVPGTESPSNLDGLLRV